ncbi:glutamate-gated chloride channel-like [Centruroides vittatus]|uniref:glutamate-gated chloride channel-like n=1 Tax=Centruroides vittatus TaxID=120091 RepID=UPI003510B5E9
MLHLRCLIVLILFASFYSAKENFREIEKRILDSIIGPGRYDSRIRPLGVNNTDGPCIVRVNVYIRSISKIDDLNMEYTVQLTLREQWADERMHFNDYNGQIRYLTLTDPDKIWKPDLFFANEKEGHFHEIIMPNVLLRIYPKGDVLYSIRISLVLSCPMDLKYYPLDKQICTITMVSYGYTKEELIFIWKDDDPIQLIKNLHLPRFTLERYETDYCSSRTNTGEYSCLKVDLLFKREFSYYLIQIYIPCCMLVIVSWVSFWLDQNAIPARVSLGVTTLLTMATQISGINSALPPVSYTKAIDIWTGVCLTFVFGALLEFALVNYASRSEVHRQQRRSQEVDHLEDGANFAMKPLFRNHNSENSEKTRKCEVHIHSPYTNYCKAWFAKFPSRSKRIDVISRLFFPIMFALFNLVYWTTYLFREEKEEHK